MTWFTSDLHKRITISLHYFVWNLYNCMYVISLFCAFLAVQLPRLSDWSLIMSYDWETHCPSNHEGESAYHQNCLKLINTIHRYHLNSLLPSYSSWNSKSQSLIPYRPPVAYSFLYGVCFISDMLPISCNWGSIHFLHQIKVIS